MHATLKRQLNRQPRHIHNLVRVDAETGFIVITTPPSPYERSYRAEDLIPNGENWAAEGHAYINTYECSDDVPADVRAALTKEA